MTVAVAVLGVAALVRPVGGEAAVPPLSHLSAPEVVDDLVAAWDRYRRTEWVMVGEFERTLDTGERTSTATVEVQRVPDRLVFRGESVTGRLGGRRVSCGAVAGETRCVLGAEVDPAREHQIELSALRSYAIDDDPVYVVDLVDGCFRLRLRRGIELPPFGREARLCFDEASGALDQMEVRHDGHVDRLRAVSIRRTVTDEDLMLPAAPQDLRPDASETAGGGTGGIEGR